MSGESSQEYFKGIGKILYNPQAPPTDTLVYRHYNADEVIEGKTMAEWLRFSVCYWHTFRGRGQDMFGGPTIIRSWDDESTSVENAKRRMRVAFEFMQKLGVRHWTFHDRDIAPEGRDLAETNKNLDALVELAVELQQKTGIRCLWGTANLFSNPRYANGAATNPDAHVFAYAASQVKKALDVTQKLRGDNYVLWGGREGYFSLLNTNVKRELDHLAAFLRMIVEYKKKIGFTGQLLIEPKPKEPTAHQYDYDAQTVIGFLKTYGLDKDFKLNIEPNHTTLAGHSYEHDVHLASAFGFLGSIDANTGDTSLGWDTDQFCVNLRDASAVMRAVMQQGGLAPGGLNFDCKVRRESSDVEDMFISHISSIDCWALALRRVAALRSNGSLKKIVDERYASFDTGLGKEIEAGTATLEQCEKFILGLPTDQQEPKPKSGKQEHVEAIFNNFLNSSS